MHNDFYDLFSRIVKICAPFFLCVFLNSKQKSFMRMLSAVHFCSKIFFLHSRTKTTSNSGKKKVKVRNMLSEASITFSLLPIKNSFFSRAVI